VKIIDAHSHILTPDYLAYVKENGAALEDGFALPNWSAEEHLDLMEQCGIEWSLLSVSSPHPHFGNDEACIALTRKMNEDCAALKEKYPGKFGFCASLPLPDVDASAEEAVYALDVLKADGIKFASNSRGLYLGDPKLDPIFEELDKRDAVVIIHPHRPAAVTDGIFSSGPIPLYEFLCDTTRAVMNMMANGVLTRYPRVKLVVPHCGSFLPNIASRMESLQPVLMAQGLLENPIDVKDNISRMYFDTAGTPAPDLLPFLLTMTTPDKIVYGADYPFTPIPVVRKNLEHLLKLFEEREDLKPYKNMILWENAEKLFHRS